MCVQSTRIEKFHTVSHKSLVFFFFFHRDRPFILKQLINNKFTVQNNKTYPNTQKLVSEVLTGWHCVWKLLVVRLLLVTSFSIISIVRPERQPSAFENSHFFTCHKPIGVLVWEEEVDNTLYPQMISNESSNAENSHPGQTWGTPGTRQT